MHLHVLYKSMILNFRKKLKTIKYYNISINEGPDGRMVKALDSWKGGRGFDYLSWPSDYASGHYIHIRLPLPIQECTHTIGYNDMHVTRRSVSAICKTIGSLSLRNVPLHEWPRKITRLWKTESFDWIKRYIIRAIIITLIIFIELLSFRRFFFFTYQQNLSSSWNVGFLSR